jgi:NAD(P) transhydrogenase subunit alpha
VSGSDIFTLVVVFVLSCFVGFEVISKVPSILHTPLMSGTNAIHGVVLVGSMVVLGTAHGAIETTLGFIAVVLSTLNVVGGFVVTDRMLEMFKSRQPGRRRPEPSPAGESVAEAPAAKQPQPEPIVEAPARAPGEVPVENVIVDPETTVVFERDETMTIDVGEEDRGHRSMTFREEPPGGADAGGSS